MPQKRPLGPTERQVRLVVTARLWPELCDYASRNGHETAHMAARALLHEALLREQRKAARAAQ